MQQSVPEYMMDALAAVGVPVPELFYAVHTDMTPEGEYADVYVAISKDRLYILYGEERIVKVTGARRIVSDYRAEKLETIELSMFDDYKTEKLLSTGRFIGLIKENKTDCDEDRADEADKADEADEEVKNDPADAVKKAEKKDSFNESCLLLFSLGYMSYADRLIKAIKNIKDGNDPLKDIALDENLYCPKCGTRYPEPERKLCPKCLDKISIFVRLLGFFKFYIKKVLLIMSVMLLSTVCAVFTPYVSTRMFIDEVLTVGGQYFGMVLAIVLLILLVRIVTVLLNIIYSYVLARTVPWIIYDLKVRIFEAMQRLSVGFYTSKRTGALMNRVSHDATRIYWFFVDGLPFLVVNIMMFIGVFIFMFFMDMQLTLICITVVPLSAFMFRVLSKIFRRFHHKSWVYTTQMNSMVSDSVHGQRVIKAFAREDEETERFTSTGWKQAGVETKMMNMGFTVFPAIFFFMFIGQMAVMAVGSMMVIDPDNEMTLGTLLAFNAYLAMLYGPLEFLSWVSNWWARCVDAAQRVFEIIDSKADIEEPEEPADVNTIEGAIEVKDAWFSYDPATPVLKGLTLSVPAGQTLGIVGKTGAGKTTLANLIARLYDVSEGQITVDGHDVKKFPLKILRSNIGIVSQDIYLFIGSIADNIRYARPEATIEDVIRAAKIASAHDFIINLPDGYETRVGAGGQDLSGGEKQRLSIARTILQNPRILILDEATAAMDTETEGNIQRSLHKLQTGRTTIAIAHRLSTLKDAHKLAVIHEGKIVETGTHEELMKARGEYHKLYTIQMEGLKIISME